MKTTTIVVPTYNEEDNIPLIYNRITNIFNEQLSEHTLIIDEWLDMKPNEKERHTIKELIHRRRRKSSTIFCSQIHKDGWYQILGGENTEAEAIMDRIAYDGYDINIGYTDPENAVSLRKVYSRLKPID